MSAEPTFVPKDGQVDFTNARFCPVINCVVEHEGKLLMVKRNKNLRLYPGLWNGISGFLDDKKTLEEKVHEELAEELSIKPEHIQKIEQGPVIVQEAPDYDKTWVVFPVHVIVNTDKYKLDSEASEAKWLTLSEARSKNLLPGFAEVIDTIFGAY
ncbi:MAG TPA: NUDIX domain-containing protein [Candidatus Saccharimonadales bacterium]|nr:NUDIX domain-containing protein [Candidatus Saccharimonadales bacterium]